MYTHGKEETYKSRKSNKNMPSFSSTLLDEIYRSIDGSVEKSNDVKAKCSKRQAKNDEAASFTRACLVEKWMEKEKFVSKRRPAEIENKSLQDNDLMFFSSTSSSSDSSGALSSSDTEFFGSTTKPKASCFSTRPKPVRTGVISNGGKEDDLMIKSKSRALKIYASLKKVKQPISPGGRLTNFINSLFSNANAKKSKTVDKSSNVASACSSASSFSRSCLSKYSPRSREKMRNGDQRTVRFDPVSVIVDEDSRPCGQKCIYDEDFEKYVLPKTMVELKFNKMEKNREVVESAKNASKRDNVSMFRKIEDEDEDEDEYDGMSDSSSDLFELDHLSSFGNNRFCEELPVYETTHYGTNLAIASGLIR